ncbi:MAG: adenylate/guanylate cyclase domain-containing protein [Sedimentitalea sp.]
MPLACVLISDITGSTQLYEKESNETALQFIGPMLDRMREIIADAGGHCVKSKGDDTLSFFEHPDAAFQAAWAMINENWASDMSVHAGVYFGEILKKENEIYGNAVNTAARLASLAKPGEFLLGDSCFEDLAPEYQGKLLPIGELQLRGKDAPTRVYSGTVISMSAQTVVFAKSGGARPIRTETADLTYGGKTWQLSEGDSISIGRSPDCDIVLDHAWVSRKHGALTIRQWQLEYADHSSAGSVIRTGEGKQFSVHRRSTLLYGTGKIVLGTRPGDDATSSVDFVAHDLSITLI